MNKVKLNLDALNVDSFETSVALDELRGTVRGNGRESIDALLHTCGASCMEPGSCDENCGGTASAHTYTDCGC